MMTLVMDGHFNYGTVLLKGVVGSTAYGLATPNSDVDRLALYAAPTSQFHGLDLPIDKKASVVKHEPDITYHEARKYCLLALQCNPTILELMWLPDYEHQKWHGTALVLIRQEFLSRKRVRDAYLGYASQQFARLQRRGDGTFSADTRKRTAKHARHMMRLCMQGYMLYATGELPIKVEEPKALFTFGESIADGDIALGADVMRMYEEKFDAADSPLPEQPNRTKVNDWLRDLRSFYA